MRKHNPLMELYRMRIGPMGSDSSYGNNGVFIIPGPRGKDLVCIVSDGGSWDHVSVEVEVLLDSIKNRRLPDWYEMQFIKDMFWANEELVVQYHPPKKDYVNVHPFVLHLWKSQKHKFPIPSKDFV